MRVNMRKRIIINRLIEWVWAAICLVSYELRAIWSIIYLIISTVSITIVIAIIFTVSINFCCMTRIEC